MWKRQNVQTFFLSRFTKYFAVEGETGVSHDVAIASVASSLKSILETERVRDQEFNGQDNTIRPTQNRRTESSPWLRRTGWIEIFEGKNMTTLVNYTSNKGSDTHETNLIVGMKRIIERCMNGVKDIEERGWSKIRFWLQSIEAERPDGRPFRMYYADLVTYINVWIELVLFCWRSHDDTSCIVGVDKNGG